MAALRRQLPSTPGSVIESVGNGYRISRTGHTVDTIRFESLVARARELRGTDPDQALCRFNDALNLWRGEVLAGLPDGLNDAAVNRLAETRLAAVEDRVSLKLQLGQHTDVVGELRQHLEQHPYRQRLAGQLMRSLSHSGRTPEALNVFADLRQRLADELGIDPDPEIVDLHTTILRADRSTGSISGVARPERPPPAQLPAAPATFVARGDHVSTLDKLIDNSGAAPPVATIAGMGGVGKTALALYWAHRVREHFPDGQLYINLRGFDSGEPVSPTLALEFLLGSLGHEAARLPTRHDEIEALYRSVLADRRVLVLLDNARDANQVRPLLPGGAGSGVVVTSRDQLASLTAIDDAIPILLDTLNHNDSIALLKNVAGEARLHEDPESTQLLASLCGHLPLALRVAAANILARPTDTLRDIMSELDSPQRIERLSIEGDSRATVTSTFDWSFRTLSPVNQRMVMALSLIPGDDFSHGLAIHLSERDEHEAAQSLSELLSAHLIESHREDRYRFHDLIREYLRSRSQDFLDERIRADVQTRLIGWYDRHAIALPAEEGVNVLAAFTAWERHSDSWKLADVARTFWRKGLSPPGLLSLCDRALHSARESQDPEAVPRIYNSIAVLHRGTGNHSKAVAYARNALSVVEQTPSGDRTGRYHANLAIFLDELGKVSESIPLLQHALKCATRANHQFTMVNCMSALGNAYRIVGQYSEAEHFLRTAMTMDDADTDNHDVNVPQLQLGVLFSDMGRLHDALALIDAVMETADKMSSVRYQILARIRRSNACRRLGDFDEAYQVLSKAMELSTHNGHDNLIADTRVQLAELFHDMGRHAAALEQLSSLPRQDADEPDKERRARVARTHGLIDVSRGQPARAIEHLSRAYHLYESMPWPLMQAQVLASLGSAFHASGELDIAQRHRQHALDIFTRLGVPDAERKR